MTGPLAPRVVVAASPQFLKGGAASAAGCIERLYSLRSGGDSGFAAEGGGGALRAQSFISRLRRSRHHRVSILSAYLVHPFATSWPSSPKGDARTLRFWLSVSYVTQYPVPPIFSFPLEGKCLEEAKGCTGQSADRMLHRGPDRQSAAP